MADIIYSKFEDAAGKQRLKRQAKSGKLVELGHGFYLPAGIDLSILKSLFTKIAQYLVPDGIISDRTALLSELTKDENGNMHLFVTSPGKERKYNIGPLIIHKIKGLGPVEGDISFMDFTRTGDARSFLDNMTLSRARQGPARTVGPSGVEKILEVKCRALGESYLRQIRDEARKIAPLLGRDDEFSQLDEMIGGFLGTRQVKMLTQEGKARMKGHPIDVKCLERLCDLRTYLHQNPFPRIDNCAIDLESRRISKFFEAYFSNYIEGTKFLLDEAKDIIFEEKTPDERKIDAADVFSTWSKLMQNENVDFQNMNPDEFIDKLRQDHFQIMKQRKDICPGAFKAKPNMAGNTRFIRPEDVLGTLKEGFKQIRDERVPAARALMLHSFIVDVHPFNDGNGRMSRMFMSREMTNHNLSHIVVPNVFRSDYIDAVRIYISQGRPDILARSMMKLQKISASCVANNFDDGLKKWASTHAFLEQDKHAILTDVDEQAKIESRHGIPAPASYWKNIDFDFENNISANQISII